MLFIEHLYNAGTITNHRSNNNQQHQLTRMQGNAIVRTVSANGIGGVATNRDRQQQPLTTTILRQTRNNDNVIGRRNTTVTVRNTVPQQQQVMLATAAQRPLQ